MSKNAIWITGTLFAILLGLAMAYMGSDEGVMVQGLPIFAGCVALSFAVQWCAFVPAYGFSTEKFYDLAGSLTYITLVAIALSFVPESISLIFFVTDDPDKICDALCLILLSNISSSTILSC